MSTIIKKGPGTHTTEYINRDIPTLGKKVIAAKSVGEDILSRSHLDNAAAKNAGLVDGDIYHTAGLLKVVYT